MATSCAPMPAEARDPVTCDTVLGGRLALRQPRDGHRVGHDAILLAAATDAATGQRAVDLFAGVGAAGLALASRVPGLEVVLVEVDAELVTLARDKTRRSTTRCGKEPRPTRRGGWPISLRGSGCPLGSASPRGCSSRKAC
jgi:hypothetical protein